MEGRESSLKIGYNYAFFICHRWGTWEIRKNQCRKIVEAYACNLLNSFNFFALGETECDFFFFNGSRPLLFYWAMQRLETVWRCLSLWNICRMLLLYLFFLVLKNLFSLIITSFCFMSICTCLNLGAVQDLPCSLLSSSRKSGLLPVYLFILPA